MERVLRVQTVKLDGPGFSSISPERRRKVEKNRSRDGEAFFVLIHYQLVMDRHVTIAITRDSIASRG